MSDGVVPAHSVGAGPELPIAWARLHPLSPLAKGGRAVLALVAVTVPRQLAGGGLEQSRLGVDAAVAALVIAAGVVSWLVTRWRVADGELQLELGLLRRQSIRVPLARVQAVDVVRPLAARLLGISELRLVLAGSGTGKARLAFLPQHRAVQVRAQLLALGAGLTGETAEAPERTLASVPNKRLIASTLLGSPAVTVAVLGTLLVVLTVVAPTSVGPVLGAVGTVLFGAAAAAFRRLNVEFNFTVAESPDGLRLKSGLLQTRAETIPAGRVQAVRLIQPLLWRPFGWCRLEVDVAQQREREVGEEDVGQLTRALLPVGDRAQADALLARVLPGAVTHPPPDAQAPRRARFKAPLSYRRLASWHDHEHFVARTGRLQAATVVVPLAKAQSIRWTQGPAQRRLRLATLHLDTAGHRWQAAARDRDLDQANELLRRLPSLARAARAR
ncbi:MAG: Bacterial rane flanked domain protein [Frankiales bacterium]|nr:Bacterial rane flanked domain protein [Frankiales bacterium]